MDDWRLIIGVGRGDTLDAAGSRNMAVDQVLFDSAKAGGEPVLRFYRWTPACVSLGRNQLARGRYDGDGRVPGIDIVRRPTGGLAVYHDQELTYSIACPVGAIGSPRATYLGVHRAIARGLVSLGVAASLSSRETSLAPAPDDPLGVCFRAPAEGEILAAAGKLVGSAQRSEGRAILQHGSILIDGSQDRAAAGRGTTRDASSDARRRTPDASGTTLRSILGRTPADDELIAALGNSFEAALGIRLAPATLSPAEVESLPEAEARYRSADWTWRS